MASPRHSHLHHNIRLGRDASPNANADMAPAATLTELPSTFELLRRGLRLRDSRKSNENTASIAIAVSVIVPLVVAFVLFIYLHRRYVRQQRIEEANDPHKSYDFGMGPSVTGAKTKTKNKKGGADMQSTTNLEKSLRQGHGHGTSMDFSGGNPYLLPPEMQQSRESLNSLSRNIVHGEHDPYRPAANMMASSIRSSPLGEDNASTRTGSTNRTNRGFRQDGMNQNLVRNAQRMSQSGPAPLPIHENDNDNAIFQHPPPPAAIARKGVAVAPKAGPVITELVPSPSPAQDTSELRQSNNYLAGFIHSREASIEGNSRGNSRGQSPDLPAPGFVEPPPRTTSAAAQLPTISIENEFPGSNIYEFSEIVVPPPEDAASRARGGAGNSPGLSSPDNDVSTPFYTPDEMSENPMGQGLGVSDVDFDPSKRLSILRPLPPDDPTDNPEQRALRIRSFYKEYFSENEARSYQAGAEYYEDYGSEYLGDAAIFDPVSGQFVVAQAPYAEPVTRRAMTPPPRGPPRRFQGAPGGHIPSSSNPGSPMGPPRGRAFSSASTSRMGPGARAPPKRLAPPKALRTLPTPHLLKEDAFVLPIDFAPPTTYKDRQAGRPESPFMEPRPFSPAVPIASPLVSAFNDMPAMPSPYMMRKSGTFTGLDFAPPPRFKNVDGGGSDNGSIRSGRSNHSAMSAAQVHNIRAGAYRLSRVPKGLVGSKQDFAEVLKPQMSLGR